MRKLCCLDESLEVEDLGMMSKRSPWFDLPNSGGGDLDLADFPLDYEAETSKTEKYENSYQNLP